MSGDKSDWKTSRYIGDPSYIELAYDLSAGKDDSLHHQGDFQSLFTCACDNKLKNTPDQSGHLSPGVLEQGCRTGERSTQLASNEIV